MNAGVKIDVTVKTLRACISNTEKELKRTKEQMDMWPEIEAYKIWVEHYETQKQS